MSYKTLDKAENLEGKKVILRIDANVPIVSGEIRDDFRLKQSLETMKFLSDKGAKTIIVAHIESKEKISLKIISDYFSKDFSISFAKDLAEAKNLLEVGPRGGFVMLENIRNWSGEKDNDENFAKELAGLGDIYVNEAFSVSHRPHASIVGLPKFLSSFAGFLFEKERNGISKVFNVESPFLFILGGAKIDTKMPLVKKFLKIADNVCIGGALANDCFRAKGLEVGKSVVSEKIVDLSLEISNSRFIIPTDVIVGNFEDKTIKSADKVGKEDIISDIGPESADKICELISKAKFILWNGPVGNYEKGFSESSDKIAKAIVSSGVKSVIGGGDTLAVVEKLGVTDKFSFVSSAGGAMLDFLANETLPGIKALEEGVSF